MTIERRIRITTGVLILFALCMVAILFWTSRQVEDGIKRIETSSQVVHSAFMMRLLMDEYWDHGGKTPLSQWKKHNALLSRIIKEIPSDSIDGVLLADLKDCYQSVTALAPHLIRNRSSRETDDHSQDSGMWDMLAQLMFLRLEQLVNAANDLNTTIQALTLRRRLVVQKLIVVLGISMVVIILLNIYFIRRSVVHPLKTLSSGAERIGAGDFNYITVTKSDDEVGKLSRAFNAMVERLGQRDMALKQARDELEQRVSERTDELKTANDQLRKEIEDRMQVSEELARSNSDLQQFAYVASHDLQEPLRNVAGCLQLLEKKYKNKLGADADQYIYYAIESAVRMKALVQDLLAYSRISTRGKAPEPVDCEQILRRVKRNLGAAVSEAGAVITHDPLPAIPSDGTQLLQVFQNLIGNAIKFRRDEPPRVHVGAVKGEDEWVFSVKDNGIGMESRHLERIFIIFQRLNKRSQYDGTGMGLAIVKKIVERHRGRVWVESRLGVGTTFSFTIPEKGKQT